MSDLPEPNNVIEINLHKVAKSSMLITLIASFILLSLSVVIEKEYSFTITIWTILFFIVGYIALIILHELFHLLGFRLFAGVQWKRMVIGFNLKLGIAYATTNQLMTNGAIRKALLLPFWTTGVVPAVIGLYLGNGTIILLAAFLIGGAAGDFAMYKELRKLPNDWLIKDDPQLPRLYVYAPERLTREDFSS